MVIKKEIKDDNELYLWFNGKLIYKRWINDGYSKVFDHFAYGKYTAQSITEFELEETPALIHIKANLEIFATEKDGRKSGIKSGYRPNHVFEYQTNGQFEYSFIGDLQFDEKDLIMPGECRIVTARFLSHQPIDEYLTIGRKWWIHEGPNRIGEAEIFEIELPRIEYS